MRCHSIEQGRWLGTFYDLNNPEYNAYQDFDFYNSFPFSIYIGSKNSSLGGWNPRDKEFGTIDFSEIEDAPNELKHMYEIY